MFKVFWQEARLRAHWLVFPFFAVIVLGLQWAVLPLPYHWDEVVAYYRPLNLMLNEGALSALLNPGAFLYHPPGMQLLAWPFYALLGDHPYSGRLFAALMTSTGLYFTFLIGRRFQHWVFGLLASCLLLSSVRVFPHALQFHADTILFGLAAAYMYAAFSKRFIVAAAIGFICALVRETAIAFGLVLGAYYLLDQSRREDFWKKALVAASPFVSLGLTFVAHRFITGNFLNHKALVAGDISASQDFVFGFNRVLSSLTSGWFSFLSRVGGREIEMNLTILLCAYFLGRQIYKRKLEPAQEWAFFFLPFVFVIFFSFNAGFLPRYLMPAYPFFVIFVLLQIWRLSHWNTVILVAAALVINPRYHHDIRPGLPAPYPSGYEFSMDYPEMIRLHQEMGQHLDFAVKPQSTVFTSWPFNNIFIYNIYGYVKNDLIDALGTNQSTEADYILDGSCLSLLDRKKIVDLLPGYVKVREITRPGMWVTLYENKKRRADSQGQR